MNWEGQLPSRYGGSNIIVGFRLIERTGLQRIPGICQAAEIHPYYHESEEA
jgi:hypothetical protein